MASPLYGTEWTLVALGDELIAAENERARVTLQLDARDWGGGCIAQSPDGRVVYDNTYRTRMQRKRRELRAMIVRDVMDSHG